MLNIDENQLKLLLEKKRKMLEQKKYDGICWKTDWWNI